MATMYDITLADMRMGVAIPIVNNSFRYWSTPWTALSGWTPSNSPTIGRYSIGGEWVGYDDAASVEMSKLNAPSSPNTRLDSAAYNFWPDNAPSLSNPQSIYVAHAWAYNCGTPGGSAMNHLGIEFGTDAAMSGLVQKLITGNTTGSSAALTLKLVEASVTGLGSSHRWARCSLIQRDYTGTTYMRVDCVGAMFMPGGTSSVVLTGVRPGNGPIFTPENFLATTTTPLGVTRRSDISGGTEKYRLRFEVVRESQATYQKLRELWDWNRGTPGIPAVPLGLIPNIPAIPPFLYVNFVGNTFPLIRDGFHRSEVYSGIMELETVW